jgi:hypothetical protein
MATLLFVVHANFAADCWPMCKNVQKLKSFYRKVLSAINNHDGPVIATLMPAYSITNGTADPENRRAYDNFMNEIKRTNATIFEDDRYSADPVPLGSPAFPQVDELLLHGTVDSITFAGGYFQSCLRETWQNFSKIYRGYCMQHSIAVQERPDLILVAGPVPTTLSDNPASKGNTYISW